MPKKRRGGGGDAAAEEPAEPAAPAKSAGGATAGSAGGEEENLKVQLVVRIKKRNVQRVAKTVCLKEKEILTFQYYFLTCDGFSKFYVALFQF
jgi:hypothetical protein